MYKPDREEVLYQLDQWGRKNNPKWDHDIFGYDQFSQDQKEFLYEDREKKMITEHAVVEAAKVARAEFILDRDMPHAHPKYRSEAYKLILGEWDNILQSHREYWIEKIRPVVYTVMRDTGWNEWV